MNGGTGGLYRKTAVNFHCFALSLERLLYCSSFYEGEVFEGIRHGYGVYRHPCGVTYAGRWSHGKRCGEVRVIGIVIKKIILSLIGLSACYRVVWNMTHLESRFTKGNGAMAFLMGGAFGNTPAATRTRALGLTASDTDK